MRETGRPDDPPPSAPPAPAPSRRVPRLAGPLGWLLVLAAVLFAAVAGAFLLDLPRRLLRPSETEIRGALYAAIQRETPETFLVTGSVDLVGTTRVRNTRRLFPGLLDLSLGTTTATVRMPGRVSYGVDLSRLTPADFDVAPDGAVTVRVPPPAIHAVEPALDEMEVQTDVGWARLYARSGRAAEQEAIALMERALRAQGEAHLRDSGQPRRNTAEALQSVLAPALEAAGVEDPTITVLFADTPRPGGD